MVRKIFATNRLILNACVLINALFFTPYLFASSHYLDHLINQSQLLKLSEKQGWLSLLHYRHSINQSQSVTQDASFFLSPNGWKNAKAELTATLQQFFVPQGHKFRLSRPVAQLNSMTKSPENHAQCRFPARFFWLSQQLKIDKSKLPTIQCGDFKRWLKQFAADSLTLVFASSDINNPVSMFGHTLLRLNSSGKGKNKDLSIVADKLSLKRAELPNSALTAFVLNYAAETDDSDSPIVYGMKGVFGGYVGKFSISPYYKHIKEYLEQENRELWEYDLSLSRKETVQLLRHLWEIKSVKFDYYFIVDNCSLWMLKLLDIARPGLNLSAQFNLKVIPIDTIKVLDKNRLIKQVQYRPSLATKIKFQQQVLTKQQNDSLGYCLASQWSKIDLKLFSPKQQAQLLEQCHDIKQLKIAHKVGLEADPLITKILAKRSQIDTANVWQVQSLNRPDDGHHLSSFNVGLGRDNIEKYLYVNFDLGLHQLIDPIQGFNKGVEVQFLNFDLQLTNIKVALRKMEIFNIFSLLPISDYFYPLSWQLALGYEKTHDHYKQSYAESSMGYSVNYLDYLFSGLLLADLRFKHDLNKAVFNTGLELKMLRQTNKYSSVVTQQWLVQTSHGKIQNNLKLELGIHLQKHISWQLLFFSDDARFESGIKWFF